MSKFRFRRLDKYKTGGTPDRMELEIPVPLTPTGKFYRWCPNEECTPRLFLLGDAERPDGLDPTQLPKLPGTQGTRCPYCGTDDVDDAFNYEGDIIAIKEYIQWAVGRDVGDHIDQLARKFNRSVAKSGFLSIKMTTRHTREPEPRPWREDLIRDLACQSCGRQYGVYAIALFCPDCASKNLSVHFEREIELIIQQVDLAEQMATAGNQELSFRLLGNAHEDVLTAFETYQKTFYRFMLPSILSKERAAALGTKATIGNRFQNPNRARELYENLDLDPFTVLTEDQLRDLDIYIGKRHVIGHNLSLADEAYSGMDVPDQPGTAIQLLADDVSAFAQIARTIVLELERMIPQS